jgi:hypothetical protein
MRSHAEISEDSEDGKDAKLWWDDIDSVGRLFGRMRRDCMALHSPHGGLEKVCRRPLTSLMRLQLSREDDGLGLFRQ